ncbi:MAG: alpha/beta hydrolase [Chromatiales bacterium]|nr:alpha/beta hydrolase [Chromatiales bacterium]
MPTIEHQGSHIYYETHGEGFPILTFAPAGLWSVIDVWKDASAPINPMDVFSDEYQVIVMDQRNAGGQSHGPITASDNWDTFTADHIAVLDDLGIERCHLYGQCIGGPFILNLIKTQPNRIASAVLAQPIGRVGDELPPRTERFSNWAEGLSGHDDVTDEVFDTFYRNLYAPGFAYCVDRDWVRDCQTPCLVLAGNDAAHPYAIAEELNQLLPNSEFMATWKSGADLDEAQRRVKALFSKHTPR